jgi:hypothetical protein
MHRAGHFTLLLARTSIFAVSQQSGQRAVQQLGISRDYLIRGIGRLLSATFECVLFAPGTSASRFQ